MNEQCERLELPLDETYQRRRSQRPRPPPRPDGKAAGLQVQAVHIYQSSKVSFDK